MDEGRKRRRVRKEGGKELKKEIREANITPGKQGEKGENN